MVSPPEIADLATLPPLDDSAMYKGAERKASLDVWVDRSPVTTWTSSGTTDGFETVDLPEGTTGTRIDIHGILEDSEWLSIIEVRQDIMILVSLTGRVRISHTSGSLTLVV